LFDIKLLTRSLEGLYSQMAAAHRAGGRIRPNLQNLDAYHDIGTRFDHDAIEIGMQSDYHAIYRRALAERHAQRPMQADGRLWSETDARSGESSATASDVDQAA